MAAQAQRYVLLDAMRGVAALAVAWGHLMDSWSRPDLNGPEYILAVDFFFVLSGFVIGHAYAARMKAGMRPRDFIVVRAIRLYPLVIIGAALGTLAMLSQYLDVPGFDVINIVGSGFLAMLALPTYMIHVTQLAFPINGPAWSLFFELGVNFVYAFIARYLTRARLIVLVALGAEALIANSLQQGSIEGGWAKWDLLQGVVRVGFSFAAGLLLYDRRPRTALPAWLGPVLLIALVLCLDEPFRMNVWGELGVAIIAFPALVWLGSAVKENRAIAKAGAFLGALSYPLYILHWPFMGITRDLFRKIDPQSQWFPHWVVLQLMLVITIAWAAMKLIDEPVRAWLSRKTRTRPAPAAIPQPADRAI